MARALRDRSANVDSGCAEAPEKLDLRAMF